MNSIHKIEFGHTSFYFFASIVFWAITIGLTITFKLTEAANSILVFSSLSAIVAKSILMGAVRDLKVLRISQLIGFISSNIIFVTALTVQQSQAEIPGVFYGWWAAGAIGALGLLAFRNYTHILCLAVFIGGYAWLMRDYEYKWVGGSFAIMMAFVTSNVQIFAKRYMKTELIKSFRQQSVYTPKQILLQAIEQDTEVSELFKPELRYSVCICSDWRSFQAYSADISSQRLAQSLEAFYSLQLELLDRAFPEGNYFMDWIADELFVVTFLTKNTSEQQLLDSATRYAIDSINERPGFFEKYGAPVGLDVGIAAGTTTVGMLGPMGNKKATALGQVPGLARRLQTLGKELRKVVTPVDRVIIDPTLIHTPMQKEHGLTDLTIPNGITVKDLAAKSVAIYESRVDVPNIKAA